MLGLKYQGSLTSDKQVDRWSEVTRSYYRPKLTPVESAPMDIEAFDIYLHTYKHKHLFAWFSKS